jgi:hypothetical protein
VSTFEDIFAFGATYSQAFLRTSTGGSRTTSLNSEYSGNKSGCYRYNSSSTSVLTTIKIARGLDEDRSRAFKEVSTCATQALYAPFGSSPNSTLLPGAGTAAETTAGASLTSSRKRKNRSAFHRLSSAPLEVCKPAFFDISPSG